MFWNAQVESVGGPHHLSSGVDVAVDGCLPRVSGARCTERNEYVAVFLPLTPRAGCSRRVRAAGEAPIRAPGMWKDPVPLEYPLASLALRARINIMLRPRRHDILDPGYCHGARSRGIRGPGHTDCHIQGWVLAQLDLPLQGPWLSVVVVLYCGSMDSVSIRWLHCGK